MTQVTIFTTSLVVPDEDLETAIKAYGLPEISKVKTKAIPEQPEVLPSALGPGIPYSAAVEEVLYDESEYKDLLRAALKNYKEQEERRLAAKLVDYIAKEDDARRREVLTQKTTEAISVSIATTEL